MMFGKATEGRDYFPAVLKYSQLLQPYDVKGPKGAQGQQRPGMSWQQSWLGRHRFLTGTSTWLLQGASTGNDQGLQEGGAVCRAGLQQAKALQDSAVPKYALFRYFHGTSKSQSEDFLISP